ncbi:MAG: hypothetical protein FWH57_11510 [Oscillospiraceae bacterium]|nr:hypothetical protein [Oscillospiraceae bacterium]
MCSPSCIFPAQFHQHPRRPAPTALEKTIEDSRSERRSTLGQTYFAIQTYRQEIADKFNQLDEDSRQLVVRGDIKQWNQMLTETARDAGVITNEEFAIFQNAGYTGSLPERKLLNWMKLFSEQTMICSNI